MNPFLELYLYFFAYNVFSKNEPTLKELIHTTTCTFTTLFQYRGGGLQAIFPPLHDARSIVNAV